MCKPGHSLPSALTGGARTSILPGLEAAEAGTQSVSGPLAVGLGTCSSLDSPVPVAALLTQADWRLTEGH